MTKRSYASRPQQSDAAPLPRQEFDLDDVTWVCEGDLSVLDLSEYARLAQQGITAESPEGMAILADVYSGLLGTNYQAFRRHCRKNGTLPEVLVDILRDLIQDTGQRPTERPSGSPDGPQIAPGTAKVVSLSKRTVDFTPVDQLPHTTPAQEPEPAAQEEPKLLSYG